jgi:hypothetical protein
MLKLRLAFAAAFLAFTAGCPTEADDLRRARAEAGDPPTAEAPEGAYACTNVRRWREDLDLPQYLKDALPNADDEARRARLQKEYVRDHEGTLIVCHNKLTVSGDRGTCSVCTEMLQNPKYAEQRLAPAEGGGPNPIQLDDAQKLTTKVEFRLAFKQDDYEKDAAAQEKSFRDWLTGRGADPTYIDKAVELEKAKGAWTKDPQNPKLVAKYGLPPLAEPFIRCPNESCKTRDTTSLGLTESRCWNCNTYIVVTSRDEREAVNEPFESLCPFCKKPVDPTLNFCDSCKKLFRAVDREGPCWRCGGTRVCPECGGSGKGTAPIFNGNDDCYLCGGKAGTQGMCPECEGRGFSIYDGALPAGFSVVRRTNDDWRLSKNGPAAAPAKKSDEGGE